MGKKRKKRFFWNHRKSSALVVSVAAHAVLITVALTVVAVKVYVKPEQVFAAKEVKRPNMKLSKLQVPVNVKKPQQAPKLRQNIIAKPKTPTMDIKMPEIVGVKGGLGSGSGGGLAGLGFGFGLPDLFGGDRGTGNEFIGHFYDLKQTRSGKPSEIGDLVVQADGNDRDQNFTAARKKYREAVSNFLRGWKQHQLEDYFKAEQEKFAKAFMIPQIPADEAPKAFGVQDLVKPMLWVALYQGEMLAPETGNYRFVGLGDDILVVRVKRETVIDASWTGISDWRSRDPDNRKWPAYDKQFFVIGDWFHLEKGKPVPMDVLIGEEPGGSCFFQLYIQQESVDYPTRKVTYFDRRAKKQVSFDQPILPIFKTTEIPGEVVGKMKINPEWATVAGPDFGVEQ